MVHRRIAAAAYHYEQAWGIQRTPDMGTALARFRQLRSDPDNEKAFLNWEKYADVGAI